MEANLGIFRGHRFIYLRCISEDGGRPVCESVGRDGAAGRDAAPMRGSQVITIMRMDVFIMGCVSRSTPPPPAPPHYLFHFLAHLSGSVCVLHQADHALISTPRPRSYSLSQEESVFRCACVRTCILVLPSSAATT